MNLLNEELYFGNGLFGMEEIIHFYIVNGRGIIRFYAALGEVYDNSCVFFDFVLISH